MTALETGYVARPSEALYDGRYGPEINLGLGTSPLGPPPELGPLLRDRDPLEELADYPEDPYHQETQEIMAQGLRLTETPHAILFDSNGSYGAGDEVLRYLVQQGASGVIAPNYSFPNVSQWCMRHSVAYTPITDPSLCPIAAQETIASLPKNMLEGKVVYLDYPNNPSGAYDAETMRSVVDHVAESGAIPIVDFAFGEVMGEEYYAALRYTLERQGIALGSVSKTQGLPGLRSGYAILPEIIARNGYSGPQRLVFGLNHEAEFVYRRLFEMQPDGTTLAHTHAERVARYNREANLRLYEALRELGFSLGTTTYETPIQIVVSEIPDFYQRLRRIGIVTESLADYAATLGDVEGLGDRAVRMLTPRPCQLEITIERLKDCIM